MVQRTRVVETKSPDGGYGWVVVLATVVINIVIGVVFFSIGMILLEFAEYFDKTIEEVAMIASVFGAVNCMSGLLAGKLTEKYGSRVTVIFGGFLCTTGVLLSTMARNLYILYITYALLVGIGSGLSFVPAILLISKYFERRHGFANGLAYSGSAIGMLAYPPVGHLLIECYGWRGTLFITAGLSAQIVVCGALMKPVNCDKPCKKRVSTPPPALPRDGPSSTLSSDEPSRRSCESRKTLKTGSLHHHENSKFKSVVSDVQGVQNRKRYIHLENSKSYNLSKAVSILGLRLFVDNPTFTVIVVAQFLEGFGFSAINAHLFARTVSSGVSKLNAAFLITIFGACSLAGRICHGFLVDFKIISAAHFLGIAIVTFGIFVLLNPLINVYAVLLIFSAMLGLSSGIYTSLIPISIKECVGEKNMAIAIGWDYLIMGFGYLVGPLFTGWIYGKTENFDVAFFITGSVLIISGLMITLAPSVKSCNRRRNENSDI
ncbi:monocarboxylate transporter 12-like [Glandiceps talaboti]